MSLIRNILWLALVAVLAAGCKTAPVEEVAVTEVALPETKPFVMPSLVVSTNQPVVSNTPPIVASPLPSVETNKTNSALAAPAAPAAPASGWITLESWALANGLDKPQQIGQGRFAVATRTGVLVIQPGSQAARWHGTQVWFGFAPKLVGGRLHVHRLDAQKTLEPLLHPGEFAPTPGRVVVIDPGHGGADGGTQGTKQQLEKNFALDWALRVKALLHDKGWAVFLTRTNDVDVALTNRVALADHVSADLFVSLHFNGLSAAASHSGVEVFCLTPVGMPSTVTRGFEDIVRMDFPNNAFDRENLQYAFRLQHELLAATRATDGGVRRARFMGVLRGQRRPAVLIEGGFLSNADEARRIATADYRQKLAEAVAKALE